MADFENDGNNALALNEPYRGTYEGDTKPNFNVFEGGGNGDGVPQARGKLGLAQNTGNEAEQSAVAKPVSTLDGGAPAAKSAEENIPSNVLGPSGSAQQLTKATKRLKGKGPLVTIVAILISVGMLIVGSSSMLPFAVSARLVEEFNSLRTTMSKRSDALLRKQLDARRDGLTTKTIFGPERFKLSDQQIVKFKTQGIEAMDLSVGGQNIRLLVFNDGSSARPILTNADVGRFNPADITAALEEALPDTRVSFTNPIGLDEALGTNDRFRNSVITSNRIWAGNFSGWFDTLSLKNLIRVGKDLRSKFRSFLNTGDTVADEAAAKDLAQNTRNSPDRGAHVSRLEAEATAENPEQRSESSSGSVMDEQTPDGRKAAIRSTATNAASTAATFSCAAYAAASNIFSLVAAQQALQMISLAAGFLESVDKVKAGDGDASPMVYLSNALTRPGANGKSAMESGLSWLFGNDHIDPNDAGVEKASAQSLMRRVKFMGGAEYGPSEFTKCAYARITAGAANIVIDLVSVATGGIGFFVKGLARYVAWGYLVEFGIGVIINLLVDHAYEMLAANYIQDFEGIDFGHAIMSGSNQYMGANSQNPANREAVIKGKREAEEVLGVEALYDRQTKSPFDTSSRHTFLGSLAYSAIPLATSTSSPASLVAGVGSLLGSSLTSFFPSVAAAAEETWLLTFTGDCPMSNSVNIFTDPYCNPYYVSDFSTIDMDPADVFQRTQELRSKNEFHTGNYGPVSPREGEVSSNPLNAAAQAIVDSRPTGPWGTECERAHYDPETGAYVGSDWHYAIPTNFKVIEPYVDEDSTRYNECMLDVELEDNGNPIIDPGSALSAYIIFCTQRSSSWGAVDANIAYQIKGLNVGAGTKFVSNLSQWFSSVPFFGDLSDMADAAADAQNAPWIGGGICVNTDAINEETGQPYNSLWSSEFKYYQRYTEDQRWLANSGLIDQSSVEKLISAYYDQNPLDNSYEGILARMSGMTKDDVIATLDLIDYVNFVAQYDPTDLYPVPTQHNQISLTDTISGTVLATRTVLEIAGPTAYLLVYADTRTRSHAV